MASTYKNDGYLSLDYVRSKLVKVWMIGWAVPMLILVVQSVLGKYGDATGDVWSWFVPLVFPTIGLMLGVIGGTALQQKESPQVKKSFYELVLWLSVVYLTILLLIILGEPFSQDEGIALYKLSNYWMAPLQGLVTGGIGYLFMSSKKDEKQLQSTKKAETS